MTFVLNQKADMLLNVERCSYLYVGEGNCVKAIMDGAKMVRVGTYTDYDWRLRGVGRRSGADKKRRHALQVCSFGGDAD